MQENYFVVLQNSFKRYLSHSLVFATLTTASLVFGTLGFSSTSNAQTSVVNNTEIDNYAKSVLAMEPSRQKAFGEIKGLIGGGEIPKIVCNDPNSIKSLPPKAKTIAVNYCNESQKIVEKHSLTIDRFNQITVEIQNNAALKQQVYKTLIRLQEEAADNPNAPNSR
ncbi:MAG: DUF4168 domain-containing protein [Nostocales cyanobacterium]|nr:MAG: DUF4168 domain-containing protein [Nostocales cyanobacterium]